jgi:hypothetical protein
MLSAPLYQSADLKTGAEELSNPMRECAVLLELMAFLLVIFV